MVIEFKETGLTEEEVINLPKVHKGSIFVGSERVFFKKNKNKILDIGSVELLRDINNIFNYSSALNTLLYIALCGHKELTTFTGDPYKKVVELSKKVNSIDLNKLATKYIDTPRELRNEYPLFNRNSSRHINCKVLDEKDLEYYKERYEKTGYEHLKRTKDSIEERLKNETNEILDILLMGKYNVIKENIDPPHFTKEERYTNEFYTEVIKSIATTVSHMIPTKDNNTPFRMKAKYLRTTDSVATPWKLLKESNFDVKTGNVDVYISNSLQNKEYHFNLYKDNIEDSEHNLFLTPNLIMSVIMKKYRASSTTLINNIIEQTAKHMGYGCNTVYVRDGSDTIFDVFKIGNRYFHVYKTGNNNYTYTEFFKKVINNIDKLINLEDNELFIDFANYIEIPKNEKWKPYEAFGLTKQTYNKVLTLNSIEKRNYINFATNIREKFPYLHNEHNLHQLFDDTFLMVEEVTSITLALDFKSTTHEIFKLTFSEYKKVVHYLDVDVVDRQRISPHALVYYYKDYIDDMAILITEGYRTLESVNLTPFSLKLEHDIVTDEKQSIQNKLDNKELERKYDNKLLNIINKTYKLKDGNKVKFLPADTTQKLKDEGKALSHCVGGYANKIINDRCYILLARKVEDLDKSWFTVEIRITDNGYVLGQQQSLKDYKLPHELKEELEKDIKKINKEEFKEIA